MNKKIFSGSTMDTIFMFRAKRLSFCAFFFCCCLPILFAQKKGITDTKYIELNGTYLYQLKYDGNDDASGIYIKGMKNTLPFDVEKVKYDIPQRIFHPQIYFSDGKGTNALFSGSKTSDIQNIYRPILIEKEDYFDLMFGGWDMTDTYPKHPHGPVDKLFMAKIYDKTLRKWQDDATNERRLILETDLVNDPSLYHINDPAFIDLGNGHYRIYFEMESLNSPASFDTAEDIRGFLPPQGDETGIPIHGIAMAESFDYGQTWNETHLGKTTGMTGRVNRSNYVKISGINNYAYAYYSIGWPAILKHKDKYLMYFIVFLRSNYAAKEVTGANTWEQYWPLNTRQTISFDRTPNVFFEQTSILLAESTDGVNFKYVGRVKNSDNSPVIGMDPGVTLIDGNKALITYNSRFWLDAQGEFSPIRNDSISWRIVSLLYIDLNDPLTLRSLNKSVQNPGPKENLSFYPTLFDEMREVVSPYLLCDGAGNLLGIGHGQWKKPYGFESYVAMANLQNYAVIKQNGRIVADFNLSTCPDETIITCFTHSDIKKDIRRYLHNNLYLNRKDNFDKAELEIYNIYGNLLLKTKPFTIKSGDKFSLTKKIK